ncbi:MAG: sensor histidine kinase [Alphaproteobacteria bacterium]|jgi:signal transduction histidine kinase|nr:sensor histidine kinase [Alphaproteobacteria bacterium]
MDTDTQTDSSEGPRWYHSLSFRLFLLTITIILLVEALIFVPSAASFRSAWLEERAQAARIAALALEAAPMREVSEELSGSLLVSAELLAVTEIADGMRVQILAPVEPIARPIVAIDLREGDEAMKLGRALSTLTAPEGRTLLIIDEGAKPGRVIEVLVPEAPLKAALAGFGWRILGLSLLISLTAGGLVYLLLVFLVVRPVRRVTRSVERFRDDPGSWSRRLEATSRRDEIGRAQNALADMERAVSDSFRQRERLAELGEAVARINHDLRGSLAAAQLVSDGLSRSQDTRVQRAAPRLERALQRAINLATQTLQYGKTKTPAPQLQELALAAIVGEAAEEALGPYGDTGVCNTIAETARVKADPDHLHRIVANLVRNAAEAMEGKGKIRIGLQDGRVTIEDDGPGLPEALRENLFRPFSESGKRGGTGLGLAIARDLSRAMGGDLELVSTGPGGTCFALRLPAGPARPAKVAER